MPGAPAGIFGSRRRAARVVRVPKNRLGTKMKVTKTVVARPLPMNQQASVLATVRKMLAKNLENKVIGWKVEDGVLHNQPIGASDCEPLIGEIAPIDSATGNTSQQRMGDRIKPKSLKVRGIVTLNQTQATASNQPLYVRVIIAQQKDVRNSGNVTTSIDTAHLLHPAFAGVGTDQQAFTGATEDLQYPINKNKFKVFMDKIIRLAPVVSQTSVEEHPRYTATYKYTFKSLPASLTYDDGAGNWCNNFAPFIALGYAYTDGSSENSTYTRVKHYCFSQLEFEDA